MTWREFANEVPTEPRSVVVWDRDCGTFASYTWNDTAWDSPEAWSLETADDWRTELSDVCFTHWRYIDPPGTAHPLAPLVSRLLSEWTRLHVPSQDWEVTGGRDALVSLVAGVARFLKVEMP